MTPQLSAVAEFFPDTTDIDVSHDFFCAEIAREVMYDDEGKARLHSVWSNGLVLCRALDREGGEMRVIGEQGVSGWHGPWKSEGDGYLGSCSEKAKCSQ